MFVYSTNIYSALSIYKHNGSHGNNREKTGYCPFSSGVNRPDLHIKSPVLTLYLTLAFVLPQYSELIENKVISVVCNTNSQGWVYENRAFYGSVSDKCWIIRGTL